MKKKKEPTKKCYDCTIRAKSIFAQVDTSTCESIDQIRQTQIFEPEQELQLKTGSKSGFYCLQAGHARLFFKSEKKTNTVRICGPGDFIGYGDWYTADTHGAVALSSAIGCYFDRQRFDQEMRHNHELSEGVIKGLCKIINLKDERISGLENHSVRNRISVLLYNLMKKFGVHTADGVLIDVSVDRRTLSELSGTVIESFARIITQLENEKIIKRSGRKIIVADKEKLYRNTYE